MTSQTVIQLCAEVWEVCTERMQPQAQLHHVEATNSTFDLADEGLMFTKVCSELPLGHGCFRPHVPKLLQEVLVVVGVEGLLHLQAEWRLAGSNLSWNMRTSLGGDGEDAVGEVASGSRLGV